MATFHGSSAEAYSRSERATILAALALALALVVAFLALAPERAHRLAAALALPPLAAVAGCAAGILARPVRALGLCVISGFAGGATAFTLGVAAADSLGFSFYAAALGVAGAGAGAVFTRLGAPGVAPALVLSLVAALSALTAARLFQASPLAAASGTLGVDSLRAPFLYENSTLGSSVPVGYPSPWIQSAAASLAGISLLLISRNATKP
jgi:di/tricarboxylate transporter